MNPLIVFGACAACAAALGGNHHSAQREVRTVRQRPRDVRTVRQLPREVRRGGFRRKLWGGPTGHKYPAQVPGTDFGAQQTIRLTKAQMAHLHKRGQIVIDGVRIVFAQTELGAPLNSATRRSLPSRAFGLPKQRKYPMYTRSPMRPRGELTFSRTHAINAKGRAKWMLDEGTISDGQYNRIVRKADRLLSMHGDR
jgi:hypothetical protein